MYIACPAPASSDLWMLLDLRPLERHLKLTGGIPVCSEFTSVSAHLETLQKQREDPLTGHPRACTADDLTYMQYRVAARASSAQAPVWSQPDATILVRVLEVHIYPIKTMIA